MKIDVNRLVILTYFMLGNMGSVGSKLRAKSDSDYNYSGGATYAIMAALFQSLTHSLRLSPHVAWRAAFVIVP
jgi:hypothetical protein